MRYCNITCKHLEGQVKVFRSDGNNWVRPRSDSDRMQTTFWGVPDNKSQNTLLFCCLWPKTESTPDQMDVMWVQNMSWGCSAATIKPRNSRLSETCPPLKEIPDEGARRRRNYFFNPSDLLFRHLWPNNESAPDQIDVMWGWDMLGDT